MKTTSTLIRNGLMAFLLLITLQVQAEEDFAGLFCPDDQYVDCNDELWDLSIYGNAYYKSYSGTYDAGAPSVSYHLNSCNQGTIVRTWSVYLYGQNFTCSQTIYVGGDGSFDPDDIHWPPKHVDVAGCNPVTDPYKLENGIPTWDNVGCSMLGSSYRDSYYYISGTCDKILREWTVIDWCVYDPWKNPYKGKYKYIQTIKISVDDVPDIICPDDIHVNSFNCIDAYVEADPLVLEPSSCGSGFTVFNNSPYAYSNGNDISGVYPIGETWVTYTIKYGCGLKEFCKIKVVVKEGKAPTPYCYAELAMPLMGIDNDGDGINDEGMVEVWAKDLDKGSIAYCDNGPLKYSFSEDPKDDVRVFTCDHLGENEVNMWVTDSKGNQSYCLVILDIQNNGARIQPCERLAEEEEEEEPYDSDAMFTVGGLVADGFGSVIPDIEISMAQATDDIEIVSWMDTSTVMVSDTIVRSDGSILIRYWEEEVIKEIHDTIYHSTPEWKATDDAGLFTFPEMAADGKSYRIDAVIDPQEYAEVDLDDVDVLFEHLIDQVPFTEAYQYVAADVDGDGSITFLDMRHMLRYITARIDAYPIKVGTVLLDGTMEFDDPSQAISESCPDYIKLESIDKDHMELSFMVVQLGELTGPADEEEVRKSGTSRTQDLWSKWMSHEEASKYINLDESPTIIPGVNISLAPNPFSTTTSFNIQMEMSGQGILSIYDLEGRQINRHRMDLTKGMNQLEIELNNHPQGMYLYQLMVGKDVYQGKLIKK
jgi:hypothetical protein